LGNACFIDNPFTDVITTRQYRPPEAILGQPYDSKVDIWSHGCMIFELITGDYLFDPKEDDKGAYDRDENHLALISELCLGFPYEVTQKGEHYKKFFDNKGQFCKPHLKKHHIGRYLMF